MDTANPMTRVMFKALNARVLGDKHIDENPNDYIYGSLTQPPIRVIDKNGSEDMLDWTVECPNCKKHVSYGTETFMFSGHIYCSNEGCREEVVAKYQKEKEARK